MYINEYDAVNIIQRLFLYIREGYLQYNNVYECIYKYICIHTSIINITIYESQLSFLEESKKKQLKIFKRFKKFSQKVIPKITGKLLRKKIRLYLG